MVSRWSNLFWQWHQETSLACRLEINARDVQTWFSTANALTRTRLGSERRTRFFVCIVWQSFVIAIAILQTDYPICLHLAVRMKASRDLVLLATNQTMPFQKAFMGLLGAGMMKTTADVRINWLPILLKPSRGASL